MTKDVKSGLLEFSDDQQVFVAVDEDDTVLKAVLRDGEGNETALGALPTDEQVQEAVDAWLDDHPEATTTVQDGAITTAKLANGSVTDDKLAADGIKAEVSDLKTDLSTVKEKLVLYKSDNLSQSDSDWTSGKWMAMNGAVSSDSGYAYSPMIPVSEGDVVRCYANRGGTFANLSLRFVTAFDSNGVAQESKGSNADLATYTVPSGVSSVILSVRNASNYNYVVLLNKTTTEYIPYFAPYYVAEYDFIEEALKEYNVPTVTPKGYNLLPNATKEDGVYYYASGTGVASGSSATYTSFIVNAKKNTDYVFASNSGARWWIVTDDDNVVVKSGTFLTGYSAIINTGNGTKIWLSCYTSDYNTGVLSLNEGYCGTMEGLQKPSFLNEVSLLLQTNKYACSLPRDEVHFTQGIDETFYYENMFAVNPKMLNPQVILGGAVIQSLLNEGVEVDTTNTVSSANGYRANIYDGGFNPIDNIILKPFYIKAKNLQNCSALVIGDSQVEQGVMTQKMLDVFTADSKTLTLLGTRGTAPNLTEGRSGWGATTYCTQASSGGVTNAFWNPSTSKFDFEYYMNQQEYSLVDFVIINLSGNDLYNAGIGNSDQLIANTVGYIFEMIDSILAFNPSQKIILNLAPATTLDETKAINTSRVVRNVYTRYNNIMQVLLRDSAYFNKVRTSYTHLVVDPSTDLADHIHENTSGYTKMANELINQINCWQNA